MCFGLINLLIGCAVTKVSCKEKPPHLGKQLDVTEHIAMLIQAILVLEDAPRSAMPALSRAGRMHPGMPRNTRLLGLPSR